MIIFGSILTTFKSSSIFGSESEYCKIMTPGIYALFAPKVGEIEYIQMSNTFCLMNEKTLFLFSFLLMFLFSAPSRRPLPRTLQPSRTRSTFAMKLHLCYPLMKLRKTQADRNDCDFSRCCEKKQFCNPRKIFIFLFLVKKVLF